MKNVIVPECIYLDTELKTQEEVFKFLANNLVKLDRGNDAEEIVKGFNQREQEISTSINNGIAIPHCRNAAIIDATVMVVRNRTEVIWTDKEKVDLMFAPFVPASNKNQMHIRILAQVAQIIMEDQFIHLVRKAEKAEQVYFEMKPLNDVLKQEDISL